jgi:RNA recognition motif-containing protein
VAVFGLSLDTREPTIESIFGKFGKIDHVTLVYDNHVL